MIEYNTAEISMKNRVLKLSTEYSVQFETHDNESIYISIPKRYEMLISNIQHLYGYHVYMLYFCVIPHGQFNRITDHKKVWGIKGIKKGIADGQYDVDVGRVYWGIAKTKELDFKGIESSIAIMLNNTQHIVPKKLFEYFKNAQYIPAITNPSMVLLPISKLFPDWIILQYGITNTIDLSIYGNQQELFLKQLEIQTTVDK